MPMKEVSPTIEIVQFEDENISTATNRVRNVSTVGVSVPQNSVTMNMVLKNAVETGTFDFELFAEGSYDRRVWLRDGLGALNISFGTSPVVPRTKNSATVKTAYPYIRMRASVAGGSALFSAQFIFSDQ